MDRQGGKKESEEVSAREEEEAKESKESEDVEDVEGGIENEASSEENSDEDEEEEGGGGPINAIISLLQLAAPILEDLSDVRTKKRRNFKISNIAPSCLSCCRPFQPESETDIAEVLEVGIPLLQDLSQVRR